MRAEFSLKNALLYGFPKELYGLYLFIIDDNTKNFKKTGENGSMSNTGHEKIVLRNAKQF